MNPNTANSDKTIMDGLSDLFSRNRRWLLFFGSGTSCALKTELGMSALTRHLKKEMKRGGGWESVLPKLEDGQSLETALTGVGLDVETKQMIGKLTGDYVARIDAKIRDKVVLGKLSWPGEGLIAALVKRLPARNPRLSIVTSNYDMLIEYACTARGIPYTTGFSGQITRRWNWPQARENFNSCQVTSKGKTVLTPLKHVELLKIHGSINLFKGRDDSQVECDLWSVIPPKDFTRVIAAPGDQKYEGYASLVDPAAVASRAVKEAMAFAMIGYGFNDQHLHGKIRDRVRSDNCPLLVLTRDLSAECIAALCGMGKQVWVLLASKNRAGKINEDQTMVHNSGLNEPVVLENRALWRADCFAGRIIGG